MLSSPEVVDDLVLLSEAELSPVEQFRKQHHTAVLVVMFTDLKGSTQLAEQAGEVATQWLRQQHDAIVREVVGNGEAGRVVKTIGDAALCVFAEPTTAVQRALLIQRRLEQFNREHADSAPLIMRIGLHMGQVAVDDTVVRDVFGRHVNRAKRVEELAHGGQVLVTLPVYDSARGWLAERSVEWHDHGEYRVKGIAEPVRVYEACPQGTRPRSPRGTRGRRYGIALTAAAIVAVAGLAGLVARWSWGPAQEIIVTPAQEVANPDLETPAPQSAPQSPVEN